MKKILFSLLILSFVLLFTFKPVKAGNLDFDGNVMKVYNAQYQVSERKAYDELDYGLVHIKDIAGSCTTQWKGGTCTGLDPQVVNVLEVPANTTAKIVNWSFATSSSWTCQTLTKMAEDFENRNPGWIVLAGINADFFDINSEQPLPKQTSGVSVTEGEVYRATSSGQQVGFTNDGSTNTLIGNEKFEVTDKHILRIYNDAGEEVYKINVDKFNEEPIENEVSVYFSYYTRINGERSIKENTAPAENSYTVLVPERCYASASKEATDCKKLYARGCISHINEEKELYLGCFSIVTNNQEVKDQLEIGTRVKIQQDVVGVYASCDNISGCGVTLLKDGNAPENFETSRFDRHPRTIIGKKADGTIVMTVVDGRQQADGMNGVTEDEMSAIMKYYGCVDAYNLDGGGSTTMIIRNEYGGFDVQNSPSDGSERNDSNCILVVVPELTLKIDEVSDTTVSLSYASGSDDFVIDNIKVHITGDDYDQTFNMTSNELLVEGLESLCDYEINCTYDLTYNSKKNTLSINPLEFSTGFDRPRLLEYYYEIVDENYVFHFKIDDPYGCTQLRSLNYDREAKQLTKSDTTYTIPISDVKEPKFYIYFNYNIQSNPNKITDVKYEITTEMQGLKDEPTPTPTPGPTPEPVKKGKCGKKNAELIITMISLSSVLALMIKKHQ